MDTGNVSPSLLLSEFDAREILDFVIYGPSLPKSPVLELATPSRALCIYTLGRFSLVREGVAVPSTVGAPRKPLELLKVIIALGGRGVCQERVATSLWPAADGDAALRSLDTTLHRLRKWLGIEGVVPLRDGRLALDSDACWVDAWAFERIQGKLDYVMERMRCDSTEVPQVVALAKTALRMYKGPFLGAAPSEPWAMAYVHRLRSKFIRLVRRIAGCCEDGGRWADALEIYQKALEIDSLVEEFYQRALLCCEKLGLRSDGVLLYGRYRHLVQVTLGVAPSRDTQQLYQRLLAG